MPLIPQPEVFTLYLLSRTIRSSTLITSFILPVLTASSVSTQSVSARFNSASLNFAAGMTVQQMNEKAMKGTLLAHVDGGAPNVVITLERLTDYAFGELVYFFWKSLAISGYLLGVNPFDQPGVEAYKKNMFALLGKPGFESAKAALEERLKGV